MKKKIGRNDPCWCGSGKKYKQCHWAFDEKLQELTAASGFSAQNQRRLHFGLGEHAKVDRITIRLNPGYYPGGQFEIITRNNSERNMYIRRAFLNGKTGAPPTAAPPRW